MVKKGEQKWKKDLLNLIGVLLMFFGIITIILSKTIITGNVIIDQIISNQASTIGIALFIGGTIILFTTSMRNKNLELTD